MARALADAGQSQTVHIVIDAQRNEFYVAKYELSANLCREVEVLKLVPAEQVQHLCLAGERVLGPEVAARFAGAQDLYPQAPVLGRLAVGRADFVAGEKLEPIYLRQADFKKAPPSRIIS